MDLEKEEEKLLDLESEMEIIKAYSDDKEEYEKAKERYLKQKEKVEGIKLSIGEQKYSG